jgi:hypothetical protein
MVNLLDFLHQKLELFRLEQRYTRRRHRRSTFVSEAQYVDGEYIYSPTSSSSPTTMTSAKHSGGEVDAHTSKKASKRLSKIGLDLDWRKPREDKKTQQNRVNVREVKWDGGVRG